MSTSGERPDRVGVDHRPRNRTAPRSAGGSLRTLLSLGVHWKLAMTAVFIALAYFVVVPGEPEPPVPRVEWAFVPAGRSRGQWRTDPPHRGNRVTVGPPRSPASAQV
jgi:hypothetical protein